MLYAQAQKVVPMEPASFTNGATASVVVDRIGFDYASFDVQLGHVDATNHPPTTLKLQEADVDASTNYTDITSPVSFTNLPPAASLTSGVQSVRANVDCRNRKRYLKLVAVPQTTQVIAANCNLSRGKQEVAVDADSGATVRVSG